MSRKRDSLKSLIVAAVVASGALSNAQLAMADDDTSEGISIRFTDTETAPKAQLPKLNDSSVFRFLMKGSSVTPSDEVATPVPMLPASEGSQATESIPAKMATAAATETASVPLARLMPLAPKLPAANAMPLPEGLVESSTFAESATEEAYFQEFEMLESSAVGGDEIAMSNFLDPELFTPALVPTSIQDAEEVVESGQPPAPININALGTGMRYERPESVEDLPGQGELFGSLWGKGNAEEVKERYLTKVSTFPLGPSLRTFHDDVYGERTIAGSTFTWSAPALYHHPLIFEQPNLERYGQGPHHCLQPFFSAAHFFWTIPQVPYHLGATPPSEEVYVLGHTRPGNCAPYHFHRLRPSWRGLIFQALATGGTVAVLH